MLGRLKTSLNLISTDAAIELISNALKKGINVKKVRVDTVGDANKYQNLLISRFDGIEFEVCPKADSIYPVVSAASIVAKVTRDRSLVSWEFCEENNEDNKFGREFGCGYPSDPVTKKWMINNCDSVFGYPDIVRFSWKTTKNFLDSNKALKVEW
jgi:ribonuclease H2 subunit A